MPLMGAAVLVILSLFIGVYISNSIRMPQRTCDKTKIEKTLRHILGDNRSKDRGMLEC